MILALVAIAVILAVVIAALVVGYLKGRTALKTLAADLNAVKAALTSQGQIVYQLSQAAQPKGTEP